MSDFQIEQNLLELYEKVASINGITIPFLGKFGYVDVVGSAWPDMIFVRNGVSSINKCDADDLSVRLKEYPGRRLLILNYKVLTPDVFASLRQAGFSPIAQWTNMAMHLPESVQGNFKKDGVNDACIETVSSESQLEDWLGIVEKVLFNNRKLNSTIFKKGIDDGIWELLIASRNGVPVSTAMLYRGSSAGVYMVATLNNFRRLGIAKKVLEDVAVRASKMSYSQVVLQSTKEGLDFYKSIGFNEFGKMVLLYKK